MVTYELISKQNGRMPCIYKIPSPEDSLNKYDELYVYSLFKNDNHPLRKQLGDFQFKLLQKQFDTRDSVLHCKSIVMATIPIIFKIKNREILRDTITVYDYHEDYNVKQLLIYMNSAFINHQNCSYDVETDEKIAKWRQMYGFDYWKVEYDVDQDYLPGGSKFLEAQENIHKLISSTIVV